MGKRGKRNHEGWSAPAWNEFTGKVWDGGDSADARALVDQWVERALGVLRNMWFTPSMPRTATEPISKDLFVREVDFIGELLSKHIDKPPNACKGLFILCVAAELGDDAMYLMKADDLPRIINGSLKERLKVLKVGDVDKIIQDLTTRMKTRHRPA
ncbi:MAG: hypothetical protein JW839_08370 [Candidatus Lokiarchaeota archaeon]|nr:hypothetical protein [Candidatus Lokiarchaeota archaeon]